MKEVVKTDQAPAAIGPYSQAIRAGGFVFVSGQIPLDPKGQVVGSTIQEQTRQALTNLGEILRAAGSDLARVVKCTVFLRDLAEFPAMNETYATFFGGAPPARATVEVSNLPKGAKIEIDAIALA